MEVSSYVYMVASRQSYKVRANCSPVFPLPSELLSSKDHQLPDTLAARKGKPECRSTTWQRKRPPKKRPRKKKIRNQRLLPNDLLKQRPSRPTQQPVERRD
jgi:hypothetical protein